MSYLYFFLRKEVMSGQPDDSIRQTITQTDNALLIKYTLYERIVIAMNRIDLY